MRGFLFNLSLMIIIGVSVMGCTSNGGTSQSLMVGDEQPATSMLLGIVGLELEKDDIEYKRRAPLVKPETNALPVPVEANVASGNGLVKSKDQDLLDELSRLEKEYKELRLSEDYIEGTPLTPKQRRLISRIREIRQILGQKTVVLDNALNDLPPEELLQPDKTAENAGYFEGEREERKWLFFRKQKEYEEEQKDNF